MKNFTVNFTIHGCVDISVSANTEEEAIEKATDIFESTELSKLHTTFAECNPYFVENEETKERKYLY